VLTLYYIFVAYFYFSIFDVFFSEIYSVLMLICVLFFCFCFSGDFIIFNIVFYSHVYLVYGVYFK